MNWLKDKNGIFVHDFNAKISYPAEGNEDCFKLEDNSLWFIQRNDLILNLINKHHIDGNFLDIGGGNGFQAKAIIKSNFNGRVFICEPGYEGCLNAKKRGIENVFNGIFENFPFSENAISVVGLFDVIEHIEDDIKFLNELYERLNVNSYVLINVPALKCLWSDVDQFAGHFRRYNKSDIKRFRENTNFEIIDFGYFFSQYVLPLFFLRVLPYRLRLNRPFKNSMQKETNNHKTTNKFKKVLNHLHKNQLSKVLKDEKIMIGSSIYMVLKKN